MAIISFGLNVLLAILSIPLFRSWDFRIDYMIAYIILMLLIPFSFRKIGILIEKFFTPKSENKVIHTFTHREHICEIIEGVGYMKGDKYCTIIRSPKNPDEYYRFSCNPNIPRTIEGAIEYLKREVESFPFIQ